MAYTWSHGRLFTMFFRNISTVCSAGRSNYKLSIRRLSSDGELSKRTFWNKRYCPDNLPQHDWIISSRVVFAQILAKLEIISEMSDNQCLKLLDLGCGISDLPGYVIKHSIKPVHLFCLDYSPGAIEWQRKRLKSYSSNTSLVVGDVCHLPFKDNFFQSMIDKGTLDSLLKDKDHGKENASKMMTECCRTLQCGGHVLQITDEDPDLRLQLLEDIFKQISVTAHISYDVLHDNEDHGYEYFMYNILVKNKQ